MMLPFGLMLLCMATMPLLAADVLGGELPLDCGIGLGTLLCAVYYLRVR